MTNTPVIQAQKLNVDLIKQQLNSLDLRPADLAEYLSVSRESVSKWLHHESFPRLKHLLQIGTFLKIDYNTLTLTTRKPLPQVNFRKSGNNKMKKEDEFEAVNQARWLELLTKYMPISEALHTEQLSKIDCNYEFVRSIANLIRSECEIEDNSPATPKHLVKFLEEKLRAFVIPVLWGSENKNHGLNVYLPESKTHWIYVNLDCRAIDFIFYIAHELAHCIGPVKWDNKELEEFCDFLAGSIIFPDERMRQTYLMVRTEKTVTAKCAIIRTAARYYGISPNTVYKQINKYIDAINTSEDKVEEKLNFQSNLFKAMKFWKDDHLTATHTFLPSNGEASEYLKLMSVFGGKFYNLFLEYVEQENPSPAVIQNILKTSITDAHAIWEEFQKN